MATQNDPGIVNERTVYHIGDTIIHWNYGPGTIVAIEEKENAGVIQQYYVVEVETLQVWVPVEEVNVSSIRFPTKSVQFEALFDILRTPGEPLSDHQYQRKLELQERMQKKTLTDLCHLIRDLADRSRQYPLNQNDTVILSRAEELLVDEWVRSLCVERTTAINELDVLLQGGLEELHDSQKYPR